MSRIRGKDTTPEKRVRSLLHRMGCRFRLHVRIPVSKEGSRKRAQRVLPAKHAKDAKPGARTALSAFHPSANNPESAEHALRFTVPDIILPRYKTAIFVHGCFWHRHRGCRNCTTPMHRRAFWVNKIEGNAASDKGHQCGSASCVSRGSLIGQRKGEAIAPIGRITGLGNKRRLSAPTPDVRSAEMCQSAGLPFRPLCRKRSPIRCCF